jgi:hypothetical protein
MGHLRTKMEQDMLIRGISERTARKYLGTVERLTRHYGGAPDTLTLPGVEGYLGYLRQERKPALGSLATVVTGLCFFAR